MGCWGAVPRARRTLRVRHGRGGCPEAVVDGRAVKESGDQLSVIRCESSVFGGRVRDRRRQKQILHSENGKKKG